MFDYTPFPSFTHTTGMTHFLDLPAYFVVTEGCVCSIELSFSVFKLIYFFFLFDINEFYVHGTVHRNSVSINVQQDATIHNLFYL